MRSCFIIGCLSVLALSILQFADSTAAKQNSRNPAKLWEYKVVDGQSLISKDTDRFDSDKVIPEIETSLNKLGSEGWELQAVEKGTLILKREKQK